MELLMEELFAGNSDRITRAYFDSLLLEMRHIDGRIPDTTFCLYGKTFDTPIMTAALSHLDHLRPDSMAELARGAAMAKAVNWVGMGEKEELEKITKVPSQTIKIIKPYADNQMIFDKIAHAEKCGCLAVGIDIDHAFDSAGQYDNIHGHAMSSKSLEELKEFASSTFLPFIVKGVLSERDAYQCLSAGAGGIVVSHHHGIMDYAIPPLMILPDILRAVNREIPVFVDCGIASGMDAFKALALGATAVCTGRAVMPSLKENGAEGVRDVLLAMTGQLKGVMAKTGCYDLGHMDATVLRRRTF